MTAFKPFGALGLALALAAPLCLPTAARAQGAESPPLVEYRAKDGDTAAGLARRLYGSARRVDLILRFNDLGPPPYRLRPGQLLRVLPDAWLAAAQGGAQVLDPWPRPGAAAPPRPAQAGAVLDRATRVATPPRAGAVVEFSDATRAQLGEASLLLIAGAEPGQVPDLPRAEDTTLLAGTLRVSRPPGSSPTVVATPSARVLFAEGQFLLRVERGQRTSVSVLAGEARVSAAGRGGAPVVVRAGQGVSVAAGRAPRPPRPLPGRPDWLAPPPPLLLTLEGGAAATGAFAAAAGAPPPPLWRLQVARDERFQDLIVDAVQPASEARLRTPALPPGAYHVRVAALDEERLEGPASALRIEVAQAQLLPAGGGQPARLRLPPGLFCSLDDGEVAAVYEPLPLAPARRHSARCALTPGGPTAELTVDGGRAAAIAHEIELGPARFGALRGRRRVALRLRDGAGLPLAGQQVLARPEGETAASAVTEEEPGVYALTVDWPRGAAPGTLRLFLGSGLQLEAPLPDEAPPTPAPAPPARRAGPAFELSAGASLLFADPALGAGRGGFLELGRRLPLPSGALGLGLRASVEDFSFRDRVRAPCRPGGGDPPMLCFTSSGGDFAYLVARTTLTLSLPVSYRLRAAERAVVPYVGLAPQLVLDWAQTQAAGLANRPTLAAYGAVHAFAGVLLRPFPLRWAAILLEGGYRHVAQDERRKDDANLSGGTLLIGLRAER